ncbi:hypothetical protein LG634_21760 [Streptomyces bambusae]|uniref:hypothetical protein n=1 Tax=Streptomyces bambusae TaxID=1550616 RepID=UPI001CFCF481|nr:hypothetical protein [Streptomyces bambusae]MCB5167443.1 hypothetical protein [Streptomyces bambusae]
MAGGVELAAAAVDAVARAAGAAVSGAGGAVGTMAVELVRGRLSGVRQGVETVSAVEQAPDDPDARARLREKLAEVLAEDPAFAAHLASLLVPPVPTAPPTSPTIRKGGPIARLVLVVVAVVLALAIYGLSGPVGDDGPLSDGSGHKVTVLKDPEAVKAITPDLHSMPAGWTIRSEPAVTACDESPDKCQGILSLAQSSFRNQSDQSAGFGVAACASAADARRIYREMIREDLGGKLLSIPALGQESSAVEFSAGEGQAYARVGTVVVYVSERGSNDDYEVRTLESLAQMIATRAQQAQDGEKPNARAR